jgi:hypothetical protein
MRSLGVPSQALVGPLTKERAGTPFELTFPVTIPERPYMGQTFMLSAASLRVIYQIQLAVGQEEAFTVPVNMHLELVRNGETVAIFELNFPMRLVPGSGGKDWIGEAAVFADLINPIEYRNTDTLSFKVSGVVPGNIGGPQPDRQREREENALAKQAEILNAILSAEALAGVIGNETLSELEAILNRLFEME